MHRGVKNKKSCYWAGRRNVQNKMTRTDHWAVYYSTLFHRIYLPRECVTGPCRGSITLDLMNCCTCPIEFDGTTQGELYTVVVP